MKVAVITVFIYSFIVTLLNIYKDTSSYSNGMEWMDIISGGPVTWAVIIFVRVFHKPITAIVKKFSSRPKKVKTYSTKQIEKIVEKIIRNAQKTGSRKNVYYDLTRYFGGYDGDYEGWEYLIVKKEKYQFINKKFSRCMSNQTDETLEILKRYFIPATKEVMIADNCNEWYIEQYGNCGLMKMK